MAERKAMPTVVIFVTPSGVREVQVHSPGRKEEAEGHALYARLRPLVDKLDRVARGSMVDAIKAAQPKRPG